MQKVKSMFQKIKKYMKDHRNFLIGAGQGFSVIGGVSSLAFLLMSGGAALPVILPLVGLTGCGFAAAKFFRKECDIYGGGLAGFITGEVAALASALLLYAPYAKNSCKCANESIFTTPGNSVTQTFNQKAPSLKDGFTYKGVTYKLLAQDMTKKAA